MIIVRPRWKSKLQLVGWVALGVACVPLLVVAVVTKHLGDLAYRVAEDVADAIGAGIESHA